MSDLYYMCNDIAIFDLEHDTVEGIKSSLSDQPMGVGEEKKDVASVIGEWKEKYCYLPDRERFAEFIDVTTMKSRLQQNRDHDLKGIFRSLTASGEYRWFLHLIVPMQRSDFRKALYVTIRTELDEEKIVKVISSLSDISYRQDQEGITEGVLWKNLILNAERMYFWKDRSRRFKGASESFLRYYRLSSEKELIGKTDEDMGWHIDPAPFREDEEEILRSGRKIYLRRGHCIVNGMNRDIIVSKIPLYRDGKIIGILGTVVDAGETQRFFGEDQKLSAIDPVTGLANARGASDSINSYLNERWQAGTDFAIIEVSVPEYVEIVRIYGESSGECLLREIGIILRKCGGTNSVIARIHGSQFCLLMKYREKEEVRTIAGNIRPAIESIRKAGQWSGSCSVKIMATFTDEFSRDQSSYARGMSEVIVNSRDSEEF